MTTELKTTPPEPARGDTAHTIARAGLSAIPFVGGPAVELFSSVIVPPLTKRRDEWIQSIAEGLKTLEQKVDGFTIETLAGNEAFVTAVMHASQVAIKNHQKEKIEALHNAVLNVASGKAPEEDEQMMFLNFIDTLTPWHVRVLGFYHDPTTYLKARGVKAEMGDRLSGVVPQIFPELKGRYGLCGQIERDLLSYGLIQNEGQWYTRRTTDMGESFLKFISRPFE